MLPHRRSLLQISTEEGYVILTIGFCLYVSKIMKKITTSRIYTKFVGS